MRAAALTRRCLSLGAAATLLLARRDRAFAQAGPARALAATAIAEVFGDGQRLTAIAIEYDRAVHSVWLSPSSFRVAGRTVAAVYAANAADPAAGAPTGPFVIVALSPDDPGATLREGGPGGPAGGPPTDGFMSGSLRRGPPGGPPPVPGPSARMGGPTPSFPTAGVPPRHRHPPCRPRPSWRRTGP